MEPSRRAFCQLGLSTLYIAQPRKPQLRYLQQANYLRKQTLLRAPAQSRLPYSTAPSPTVRRVIQRKAPSQQKNQCHPYRPLTFEPPQSDTPSPTEASPSPTEASTTRSVPAYELTVTCRPCLHRSAHRISHQGYHHGTVLVTCPECKNRHVISDHLKIFSDRRMTIEDILKDKGELLKKGKLGVGADRDMEFWDDGTETRRQEPEEGEERRY